MKKTIYTILSMLILFLQITYSQNNTFKLGFTGMYPNNFGILDPDKVTYQQNWNWYQELNLNYWQGWWIGDTAVNVMQNLSSNNLYGYFQPDTIRWAGYGRQQINYAADGRDSRFKYNSHYCGETVNDNSQWGTGQLVMYYDKNSYCDLQQGPTGLVLWNVNENGFQTFSGLPYNPAYQVPMPDSFSEVPNTYYIKPRMRISVVDAGGPNTEIVRIIVRKFNGDIDLADTMTIYTNDFNVQSGSYDGSYIEDFDTIMRQ